MCWLIYFVYLVYIQSLNSDLSIHTVSAISPRLVFFCFTVWQMSKADTMCWLYIYCTCESSCHDLCSIYWFLIHCIKITYPLFDITLWLGCTNLFQYSRTWKRFSFIKIHFLRYIYQKFELTCSYINTKWLITKSLLSTYFFNQLETQMFIYF